MTREAIRSFEDYYRRRCPSIGEIQITEVADPRSPALSAIIVPDFEYLKRKRIVNSRKRIHFEMENAALHLPPSERISHYIVKSSMAPDAGDLPYESDEAARTITTFLRQFKT